MRLKLGLNFMDILFLFFKLFVIKSYINLVFLFKLVFNFFRIYINGDWGLGIGDWGLWIGPNPQSPIPNPQSPIPNPQYLMC